MNQPDNPANEIIRMKKQHRIDQPACHQHAYSNGNELLLPVPNAFKVIEVKYVKNQNMKKRKKEDS